jgi:opacity protein-like surface antigen
MQRTLTACAVACLVALTGQSASAQSTSAAPLRSATNKFFFGVALNGSAIQSDDITDSDVESGGGLEMQLGYAFTPKFALFLDGTGANMSPDVGDSYGLGHFDIGARWQFSNPSRALVPFVDVALTGRAAVQQDVMLSDEFGNSETGDLSVSGAGFTFGGGLNYHVSPRFALTTGLRWTVGEFSQVKFNNVSVDGLEVDATTTRFNLGFVWYPRGGR